MTDHESLIDLWERVMSALADELSPSQFDGFVKQIRPLRREGAKIQVAVPSGFIKDGIERGLKKNILRQLRLATEESMELYIQVEPTAMGPRPETGQAPAAPGMPAVDPNASRANLNPKYRMEYYVVGTSNRFAHAAALGVIKSPGEVYNPLFLWGPVGVGKTHLMQAIGHRVLAENARTKVVYVTAEVFTSECIDAIREHTTKEFQKRYRTVDVLLIDDAQFFEQTQHIQESFFHTFNELYQKGKQIVLTSDRPPKALNKLQERLVNRFESGLTADLKPPDRETREAILRELADRHGITVEEAPLSHLAERCASNVRELEGSFTRVTAYASLHNTPITIPLIDSVLEDLKRKEKKRELTADTITQLVAEHFQVKKEDLMSRRQQRHVVTPRQVAMYLIYDLAGLTLKQVAEHFGKKDHSTVIHGCAKVKADLEDDRGVAEAVKLLKLKLKEMTH
jgi:chromosomal replication initiator protein